MKITRFKMICYNPICMKRNEGKPFEWYPRQHPNSVKICPKCKVIFFRDIKPDEKYLELGLIIPFSIYTEKKLNKNLDKEKSSLYAIRKRQD